MELNIKFDEKLMVETANRVLDEYEYNGKTIREWADLIANPKTNADRIRAMTDEELAVVIAWPYLTSPPWCSEHTTCPYINEDPTPCDKCALKWLKEEAASDG